MLASDCRLGKRIKNKETKDVLEIQIHEGTNEKVWVNIKYGDIFDWVDEDLHDDL